MSHDEAVQAMKDQVTAVLEAYDRHNDNLLEFKRNLKHIQSQCPHRDQEQLFTHLMRCKTCKQEIPIPGDNNATTL